MNLKHYAGIALVALVLIAMQFSNCGCSSTDTAVKANLESARLAWPAVNEDLTLGLEGAASLGTLTAESAEALRQEADRIGASLNARIHDKIAFALWGTLQPWALQGIDDQLAAQAIGENVAGSLREQVAQFTAVMQALTEIQNQQ